MYGMYRQGIAVSKCMTALLFVFRRGNRSDQVTVSSGTGRVSHAVRIRESGIYDFVLEARLTQGSVEVFLLDQDKRPLMKLSRGIPAGRTALDGNGRYYLRWEFQSASGECVLRW